jgi:hypothetical protein
MLGSPYHRRMLLWASVQGTIIGRGSDCSAMRQHCITSVLPYKYRGQVVMLFFLISQSHGFTECPQPNAGIVRTATSKYFLINNL